MTEVTITRTGDGPKGHCVICQHGVEADLTRSATLSVLTTADHTATADRFRSTGAGLALVMRIGADGGAEGFASCRCALFVNAQRKRHPERADAFSV